MSNNRMKALRLIHKYTKLLYFKELFVSRCTTSLS